MHKLRHRWWAPPPDLQTKPDRNGLYTTESDYIKGLHEYQKSGGGKSKHLKVWRSGGEVTEKEVQRWQCHREWSFSAR
jgi:hypothetical protein